MADKLLPIGPTSPLTPQAAAQRAKKADDCGARANKKFSPITKDGVTQCPAPIKCPEAGRLGSLSARYESGSRGAAAIGYDRTGGWSYGKYQIATKTGTMKSFLGYIGAESPELAKILEDAGGYKAALAGEKRFKEAWGKAAKEPAFEELQHKFVQHTHYDPLCNKLTKDIGLGVGSRSDALQNVVWSIGVQHGPSSKVIENSLEGRNLSVMTDGEIIDAIYDEREKTVNKNGKSTLKYFSGSSSAVQAGIAKRFKQERYCAKQMLKSTTPRKEPKMERNYVPGPPRSVWV